MIIKYVIIIIIIIIIIFLSKKETWEEESLSSLETQGSMERITLTTAWEWDEKEEKEELRGFFCVI